MAQATTFLAHLAGALAVSIWILLPLVPDWRWMLHTAHSPWYPTARLFRQTALGDWQSVIHAIAAALRAVAEKGPTQGQRNESNDNDRRSFGVAHTVVDARSTEPQQSS